MAVPSRPAPLKCPTGKKCFRTAAEADPYLHATAEDDHPSRAKRLGVYTCHLCLFLHIGHDFGSLADRTARRGKHRRIRPSVN